MLITISFSFFFLFFFFNDTATTEIYTLSLHDALPISQARRIGYVFQDLRLFPHLNVDDNLAYGLRDRKSTRLNSSHMSNSYAVFCLKKKKYIYNHFFLEKKKQK